MNNSRRNFHRILLLAPLILGGCLLLGPSGIGLPDLQSGRDILLLRLTRVISGLVVGAALSCAGVVFQAILRNPLAEPYVLGVSSGAGLGAAFAILSGLAAGSALALPASAFVMASLTLALVYGLSGERGESPSAYTLVLCGVMVSAICSSLLMFLVSVSSQEGMHNVVWWMLGDLEVASHGLLVFAALLVVGGCAGLWLMARELNALMVGHELAHHLGIRVRSATLLALALATLLAATAVAQAGLIGFVGLIVPHALRHLVGPDHRRLVPAAALGGGAFLAACDALARTLPPVEIPVGVVTALLGGPFFLYLLHRRRSRGVIR
jgi:iron complex transport system permease protein